MKNAAPSDDLDRLKILNLALLRADWLKRFGDQPPAFRSRDLLLRALHYRLQAAQQGDLRPSLKRRLSALAAKFSADPSYDPAPRISARVGSALVRDWNGVRHVVLVTTDGFQYGDATYTSLTQVAKVISGTHQSGPRFFGVAG
ncbi:MAG: DUF2924 domain-containing protein [Alphaproteobacteria bacterium]|nr:DUF2924 domain-containing protein [Alphaproteobacteria bacterium]